MESRSNPPSRLKKTSLGLLSLFNIKPAITCSDASIQEYFFNDNRQTEYLLERRCLAQEYAGKNYFDAALSQFTSQCGANFSVLAEVERYEEAASFMDGYLVLRRERDVNGNSTFEKCISDLLSSIEKNLQEDRMAVDRWMGIGIAIFCGILFLGFMICLIGGLSCEHVEKKKKKAVAKQAELDKVNQVEEVVIDPIGQNSSEEFTTSSTMSRISNDSTSSVFSSSSEQKSSDSGNEKEKIEEKEIITASIKM